MAHVRDISHHAGNQKSPLFCRQTECANFCDDRARDRVGSLLGLAGEFAARSTAAAKAAAETLAATTPTPLTLPPTNFNMENGDGPPMMCAIRGVGKTLDFAISESRQTHRPLYTLLFMRSLPVLTEQDYKRKWQEDDEARLIFLDAKSKANGHPVFPCYAVSDSVATTIVDITATMDEASYLILGAPERQESGFISERQHRPLEVADNLPDTIHLLVYA